MLGIETNMYSTHVYTKFGVDLKVDIICLLD